MMTVVETRGVILLQAIMLLSFTLVLSLVHAVAEADGGGSIIEIHWPSEEEEANDSNAFSRSSDNHNHQLLFSSVSTATITFDFIQDNDNYCTNNPTITVDGVLDQRPNSRVVFEQISCERRTNDIGEVEHSWYGEAISPGTGFAFVLQSADGFLTGSFSSRTRTYGFDTLPPDGSLIVRNALWEDIRSEMLSNSTKPVRRQKRRRVLRRSDVIASIVMPEQVQQSSTIWTMLDDGQRRRRLQGPVIDLMFVVTYAALCEFLNNPSCDASNTNNQNAIVPRMQSEVDIMNQVLGNSGVSARVNIASIVFIAQDYPADGNTINNFMAVDATIANLRRTYYADLVAMIVRTRSPSGSCGGIGSVFGPYSVTEIFCTAFLSYVVQHEIGHNLGGRHNREDTTNNLLHAYGHGYRDAANGFHTVMSYPCPNRACPETIPYFSTPSVTYNGLRIGDASHDNARFFNENAPTIERWAVRPNPTPAPQQPAPPPPTGPTPTGPTPTPPTPPDYCVNCKRLFNRVFRQVQAGRRCRNRCRALPNNNVKLFIPDHLEYCPGLCDAMDLEHKAKRACNRRTPFCG